MPNNATFNHSDTVTLRCLTGGGPGNTFQWSFNGNTLENETSENLTLTNVTAMDDGGMYTCTVNNTAGSDSYSTYLFISPMITASPTDLKVTNNTPMVSFSCDATAFPAPQFEWFREGGSLPDTAVGANTRTLTISLVAFGDEGVYYCRATSNDLTVNSDRATLFSELILH